MKAGKYVLLLIAFLPLLCLRDFTPNNELKYLSIADEAIENGTFLTFYNHGQPYADKPPLYFWIIMAGKLLLGRHSMCFIGLFSLLPALLILRLLGRWLSPYLKRPDLQSSSLMLITTGLFAGSAIVLRMDMLMCLFIFLAFRTFYKIYVRENSPRDKFLLPVYIFLALFTKGPVGLLLPLIAIPVFLLSQKKLQSFGHYFGLPQWIILVILCGLWFTGVYAEGGKEYLDNLLFKQTVHRAVDSFHHKAPFWYYFRTIWHSLAPWSLFYLTVILIALWKKLLRRDIEKFFFTVIAVTFIMLSLVSSKLDIYLLPAFPFFTGLAFLLLDKIHPRLLSFTVFIPALLLLLAFPASYILFHRTGQDYPFLLQLTFFSLAVGAVRSLYFLYTKHFRKATDSLSVGILVAVFSGGLCMPAWNRYIGFRELCSCMQQVARQQNIQQYRYYNIRSAENMDVYLHRKIQKTEPDIIIRENPEEDFILLVRQKDLIRNASLGKLVKNKRNIPFQQYNIVIFQGKIKRPEKDSRPEIIEIKSPKQIPYSGETGK